jgi:cytoskeletal protein CcmA (bactofilin family)
VLKPVAGDLVVTGGTVTIAKNVTVGRLLASGGDLVIDGDVSGIIRSMSGKMELNGTAMKNIDCRGGRIIINGRVPV